MGSMGAMASGMGIAGGLDVMTVLKYVAITLGGGALLGLVSGKVFASIRYPNPEKRQLFNTWQKIVVLILTVLSLGLIAGALFYKPDATDPALAVGADGSMGVMDSGAADGGAADAGGSAGGGGGGGSVAIMGGGGSIRVMGVG